MFCSLSKMFYVISRTVTSLSSDSESGSENGEEKHKITKKYYGEHFYISLQLFDWLVVTQYSFDRPNLSDFHAKD